MNKDIFNLKLLNNCKLTNTLQFPIIQKAITVPHNVISFNYAKTCIEPQKYYVHFYIDDYQFERIWHKPEHYTKLLSRFGGIIGPDFSTYTNMPIAQQIFQVYKSKLLVAYWQSRGLNVIPNISWSDLDSLNWCLEGIPKHSVISLSTNGVLKKNIKQDFIQCYKKTIEILEPIKIIIIGEVPEEIKSDKIINFSNRINYLRNLKNKE